MREALTESTGGRPLHSLKPVGLRQILLSACEPASQDPESSHGKRLLESAFVALLLSSNANAQVASSDLPARLVEADRLAWLTNWYDALPIYIEVERAACKAGHRRDAMDAKFGSVAERR